MKRGKLEIIKDILETIKENKGEIKPTPLIRKSNLSSQRFIEYVDEMKSKGFIEEVLDKKERKHIKITPLGQRYLEKYKSIVGFIEEFEL